MTLCAYGVQNLEFSFCTGGLLVPVVKTGDHSYHLCNWCHSFVNFSFYTKPTSCICLWSFSWRLSHIVILFPWNFHYLPCWISAVAGWYEIMKYTGTCLVLMAIVFFEHLQWLLFHCPVIENFVNTLLECYHRIFLLVTFT